MPYEVVLLSSFSLFVEREIPNREGTLMVVRFQLNRSHSVSLGYNK